MDMLASFRRAIGGVTEAVGGAAALLVVPLVLATTYEVLARYLFGRPTLWAFEFGYMMMGVHFLLGGALTLKHGAHVRIDLIYAQLSPKRCAAIDLTFFLLLLVPALWLIVDRYGAFALRAFETGERSGQSAWNPPIWPFRFAIVAGFALLLLQVVAECIKCVEALFGRRNYPED
jgi:TRAP-type mannitol/chloroaromatic compound transport system permease small subunit